ncbi:hypothetical protein [Streptomyces sp. A475]|uniref:hypothetical protein n=1 Tax=Streptomyces sp. A475 TaxID=3131976 RepID=UPI004040943B
MGLQNAVARRGGAPDLTTTVSHPHPDRARRGLRPGRRGGAPARPTDAVRTGDVPFGALVGAVFLKVGLWLVLGVELTLLTAGAVALWRLSVPGAGWATAP